MSDKKFLHINNSHAKLSTKFYSLITNFHDLTNIKGIENLFDFICISHCGMMENTIFIAICGFATSPYFLMLNINSVVHLIFCFGNAKKKPLELLPNDQFIVPIYFLSLGQFIIFKISIFLVLTLGIKRKVHLSLYYWSTSGYK